MAVRRFNGVVYVTAASLIDETQHECGRTSRLFVFTKAHHVSLSLSLSLFYALDKHAKCLSRLCLRRQT